MDDHAGRVGACILNAVFSAFMLGLILLAVFGTSLAWAWWLLVPFTVGGLLIGIYGSPPRRWRPGD